MAARHRRATSRTRAAARGYRDPACRRRARETRAWPRPRSSSSRSRCARPRPATRSRPGCRRCRSADRGAPCVHTRRAMTRSWFLMALFACGTTPKREEPAPAPAPTPAPADAAIVVDARVVASPSAPCELQTDQWRDQPTALALGNKPFVDMLEVTHATVDLATDTATLRTRAITVTGAIAGLNLHAAVPFVLGNYAAPGA